MNDVPIWVECGADTQSLRFPFTRKHYFHPSQVDEFRWKFNNVGVYETVMRYIDPVWFQNEKGQWVINARDSLKYGDLYLDFDYKLEKDEDFEMIRSDVQTAIRYLKVILSIEVPQINIFYSGYKGIHLTVDARVLGVPPHQALNQIFKEIAMDISKYTLFNTLDTRVYDDKRMFRMINSYNKKGQRYKIPLTYQELCKLSLAEIRELAIQPRFINRPPIMPSPKAKVALEKYIQKWTQSINRQKDFRGRILKLDALPACIEAMLNKTFRETIDERNNSATALCSFFLQRGMEREEAIARLLVWGEENCLPPLPRREIETIVHSVYNGQYRYGCETFHRLSGVCDKENCPLFKKG
jgi:hypothetical protein